MYRRQAAQYLESVQKLPNEQFIVPTQLASVFSTDEMPILESMRPSRLLEPLWMELWKALQNHDGRLGIPHLDLQAIQKYRPIGSSDAETTALSQIAEKWIKNTENSRSEDLVKEDTESVAALLLLGWRFEDTAETAVVCQCRLCHCRLTIPTDKVDIPSDERPTKRARMDPIDPFLAHRHYCPYVCGFPIHGAPRAKPIWQSLLDRLRNEFNAATRDTAEKDSIWIQVHKVLQSGISRKTPPSIKKPQTKSTQ